MQTVITVKKHVSMSLAERAITVAFCDALNLKMNKRCTACWTVMILIDLSCYQNTEEERSAILFKLTKK